MSARTLRAVSGVLFGLAGALALFVVVVALGAALTGGTVLEWR